ncbi:MAG: hypothetical protein AB7F41_03410 [Methylocystis sp.]|uniref:hypothetical protein n=1 Tax=Methylocystis sp. TaxID=1911079 RepID=UPI003D0F5B7E
MSDMITQERALPRQARADASNADAQEPRPSALGASAGARLSVAALLLVTLWAAAYWALH